jgi:hypothetical protein
MQLWINDSAFPSPPITALFFSLIQPFTSPTAGFVTAVMQVVTSRKARDEDILETVFPGFAQNIIGASHQRVFFSKHFSVFANESQTIYIWINHNS